jgi:4-hydroxy-3-polyprenylbenzoate decarboxylase/2,5-furandicarboxylate decarboxylase 1
MAYQDFREFLEVLRRHGELMDINRPIALIDVGKALKKSYACREPALMFNQDGTDYPLVAGVYSTPSKARLAFEASEETIFEKVVGKRIPSIMVPGQAPCRSARLGPRKRMFPAGGNSLCRNSTPYGKARPTLSERSGYAV